MTAAVKSPSVCELMLTSASMAAGEAAVGNGLVAGIAAGGHGAF